MSDERHQARIDEQRQETLVGITLAIKILCDAATTSPDAEVRWMMFRLMEQILHEMNQPGFIATIEQR